MSFPLYFTFTVFVFLSWNVHKEFNKVAPTPWHDESLHLIQVQNYCNGSFHKWNKKITTLPGLYFYSVGSLKPLEWIFGIVDHCSLMFLRSLSLLTGFGVYHLVYWILDKKYPDTSSWKKSFTSLNISLFPLIYFYYFMYYTESLSMILLLLMHYHYLENLTGISAVYGALAVFTRQSNIIWVVWHAAMKTWELSKDDLQDFFRAIVDACRNKPSIELSHKYQSPIQQFASGDFSSIERPISLLQKILRENFYYLLIGIGFITFVILNDGIVVGDRRNHIACLNLPQFLYFSLYTAFFLSPIILTRLGSTIRNISYNLRLTIILAMVLFAIVHWKTMMHWYILSDNRHIVHYVGSALHTWYPLLKYCLVPFYIFSWYWIIGNLQMDKMMKLLLLVCIGINVVPQLLLEFRYFVPGYIFIRLNVDAFKWKDLVGELILYCIVNYLIFNQFLYKSWETDKGTQRLMW